MFTQAHSPMINHLTVTCPIQQLHSYMHIHVHRHGHRLKRAEMNEGWLLRSLETLVRCWQALPRAKWHVVVMSPLLSSHLTLLASSPSLPQCWNVLAMLCWPLRSDSTFFSFCFHSTLSISLPLVVDTACTGCAILL